MQRFANRLAHVLYDEPFLYNQPFLKEYISADGNSKYKLTVMKTVRNKLVEHPPVHRSAINTEKLDNNLQRARSKIYEYAYCNSWDFFFTGTLDKTKASREDITSFKSRFHSFICNLNRKYNCKIKSLLIPELHSDLVSWHFHGFVSGIPASRVVEFHIGDKMR